MEQSKIKQTLKGAVVSDKMAKTIVVEVKTMKAHPKYHKRYLISKKFKAHDEKKQAKIGDVVLIEACRPISKDKCWRLIKIFETNQTL